MRVRSFRIRRRRGIEHYLLSEIGYNRSIQMKVKLVWIER